MSSPPLTFTAVNSLAYYQNSVALGAAHLINTSSVVGATVKDALNTLASQIAAVVGPVTVNGSNQFVFTSGGVARLTSSLTRGSGLTITLLAPDSISVTFSDGTVRRIPCYV